MVNESFEEGGHANVMAEIKVSKWRNKALRPH